MNINTINPYDSHVINYGKEGFDKGLEVKQYKDSSGNKVKDYLDINGKLIWRASVLQDNSEVISYFDRNAQGSIINRYDETRNAKGELVEYYEVTRSGQSDSALTNKVTRKFNNKEIITNSKIILVRARAFSLATRSHLMNTIMMAILYPVVWRNITQRRN